MSNATARETAPDGPARLTARQRQVLEFIDAQTREQGYPPSVREIGEAVGLSSPSTVHAHLAALQDKGYLRRDPTKPRAIEVALEPSTGTAIDRRPVRNVPLLGDVAAGPGRPPPQNLPNGAPLPPPLPRKRNKIVLRPSNATMEDLVYDPTDVQIYGKLVTLLRRL